MGKIIYKYPAPIRYGSAHFKVAMPKGAKVISLQLQHGEPQMWAEVPLEEANPRDLVTARDFQWVPTGGSVPLKGAYVGTLQFDGGSLIFHLYELT